jgi:predicted MFS family arabinose efflux permease
MAAPPAPATTLAEWRGGWPVVLAAMLGSGLGPGLYQNLSSLFTPGLEQSFGWSRGVIATAAGLGLLGALAAPLIGRFADRAGVRRVIVLSMLVLGVGYLVLASIGGSIWQYRLGVGLLVLAVPGTSSLVYGKLIAAAFVRSRGMALALGTSGLAFITIVVPPALEAVIHSRGWRAGFLSLAVASSVVALPLILLAIRGVPTGPTRRAPEDRALLPPVAGATASEARRDARFWIITASATLINFATTGLVTQLVPLGLERGLGSAEAALLLTSFGMSTIVGRLAIGALVDRMRPQPAAAAFALLSAAAFAALALGVNGLPAMLVVVFLAGLMSGAENDLLPFLAARLFGLRSFAEIYGSAMPVALLGTAAGIVAYGRLHDMFGSYDIALTAGAVALLLAGCSFLLLRDRPTPDPA